MIAEILFNLVFIVLSVISFYYINDAKRYESDFDKRVLNLFSLGLFLLVVKSVASIAILNGVRSFLMSPTAITVYGYLIALSFLLGAVFLKDAGITSEE